MVEAEVQDPDRHLHQVTIHFAPLAAADHQRLLELLEAAAASSGQRQLNDLLPESDPLFGELSALLLPAAAAEIRVICKSCHIKGTVAAPCPTLLPIYRQLAAMIEEEAIILLRLRGYDWQELQQALQMRRTPDYGAASGGAATSPQLAPTAVQHNGLSLQGTGDVARQPLLESHADANALAAEMDHFWGSRKEMESFHYHIAAPAIDLALLRRLGALPNVAEADELYQQLAALYRVVTVEAQALAYASDGQEVEHE